MLYIAFVCIFLSIFLFTYNKNHLSKKKIYIKIIGSSLKILTYIELHCFLKKNSDEHKIILPYSIVGLVAKIGIIILLFDFF